MSTARAIDIETVAGLATSSITKVTTIFVNAPGPLPLERAFQSSGGSFLIFVSGSLMTSSQPLLLQLGIFLDGEQIQTGNEWANVNGHLSLIPVLFTVPAQPLGNHTLRLSVLSGKTGSDFNDYYNATVIELSK